MSQSGFDIVDIVDDFLLLELGSADVILCMQWLEALRAMAVNWRALSMKFKVGETPVVLQGDPCLCKSPVSLKTMMRALKQEGHGFWVELGMFSIEQQSGVVAEELVPTALRVVLQRHAVVFQMPPSLPPLQLRDHSIPLKARTSQLISVLTSIHRCKRVRLRSWLQKCLPWGFCVD